MNPRPCFLPFFALLALAGLSCTTTTNTYVIDSNTPTITRFSPDTVWTLQYLTIYGTNFGYSTDAVLVTFDTAVAQVASVNDTVMKVVVPEGARTGFIHVRAYEQTATSAKPVTIHYTFSPHTFSDTLPIGASFSILGTGMNNYRGALSIFVNGILLPIDSIFPDRIVSHVVPNAYSGDVTISDSTTTNDIGVLTVTVPSTWNTLSEIWDRLTVTETHIRTGYINGPDNMIDSIWQDTATYSGQRDINISGISLDKTGQGMYSYTIPALTFYHDEPLLQMNWNAMNGNGVVILYQYSVSPTNPFHSLDTLWAVNYENVQTFGQITDDIELVLPSIYFQITEDSADANGLVNWQETTTSSRFISGSFDLIFKK